MVGIKILNKSQNEILSDRCVDFSARIQTYLDNIQKITTLSDVTMISLEGDLLAAKGNILLHDIEKHLNDIDKNDLEIVVVPEQLSLILTAQLEELKNVVSSLKMAKNIQDTVKEKQFQARINHMRTTIDTIQNKKYITV